MHPDTGKFFPRSALGLGNFIFMVGKHKIATTTVNIKVLPRHLVDIAEHSICQPGRPNPRENPNPAPLLWLLSTRTKSLGSFLLSSTSILAPAINSSRFFGKLGYSQETFYRIINITIIGCVSNAFVHELLYIWIISAICPVALRLNIRRLNI